ncbi:thrombospondin type-1 domain-containing protein 1 [Hemiscyllium ocellatum]|uniref:thrombospondin type-1 domain-containing protein 1 n=1 Tax=Hemiscyllium ocellatum TaxID=170820 RepID=UPI002965F261|nr:thrombospondin type-1 domain-containing protein 1 [Hemiscyllium ocellatum]
MSRILSGFTHVLLLAFSGYAVFAEFKYRLSKQPWHVALSNQTVQVDFKELGNASVQNLTVSLIDVNRNRTVTTKVIAGNRSQSSVEFECFHFNYAGNFEFRVTDFTSNSTTQWATESFRVKWPDFYIELARKTDSQSNFRIHVFTHEYLCPRKVNILTLILEVTRIDLNEPGVYNVDKVLKKTINKEIVLSNSQWVIFDCTDFSQDALIMISLRSPSTNSVISSKGPLVFTQIIGYKLLVDHLRTATCESSAEVGIVTPPCTHLPGKISVYKNRRGASFGRDSFVAEKWLRPRDNKTEFDCSVFDAGKNNYCFEYVSILNHSHTSTKAVNCVTLQKYTERGSVWLSWSPCSVTCGDGVRERYRQCVASFLGTVACNGEKKEVSYCSLVDCAEQSAGTVHNEAYNTGNIVTITGISLCLVIIIATIAITVRTKLSRKTQACSTAGRQGSGPPHSFRKNLENERNFCDLNHQHDFLTDNVAPVKLNDGLNIPFTYRRSQHFLPNQDLQAEENPGQQSAQKVIPPIFGYRLAHQQLKEMKKQGITEATQVYHVTQHPLDDTVTNEAGAPVTEVDQTNVTTVIAPHIDKESDVESSANRFRIQSPFTDQKSIYYNQQMEKANHRMDYTIAPFPEPFVDYFLPYQMPQVNCTGPNCEASNKTLPGRPRKFRRCETEIEMCERGSGRNPNFRRTSSFNECKTAKSYRERSQSTCTQKLPSHSHSRAICKTAAGTDRSAGDKVVAQSRFNNASLAKHHGRTCSAFAMEPSKYHKKSSQPGAQTCKTEMANDQQTTSSILTNSETCRGKRRSSMSTNRYKLTPKVSDPNSENCSNRRSPRSNPLPRHQYRHDRCQSFPSDPNFLLYDNSGFELTTSEQQIIDLPARFSSHINEDEEDTSTLSNEKLVI